LYGAHLESFCAQVDGTYRCGSGAASEFCVAFSGAEATHCSFIHKSGTLSVKRIDGRVWVNDLPVSGLNRLTEGDVISLGPVSYRLEYQDAPSYLPEPDDRPLMSFQSAATVAPRTSADLTTAAIPIPVVIAAPSAPDTSIQIALLKGLQEELTLRQQQLADLTQIVRERERDAYARLILIEDRRRQAQADHQRQLADAAEQNSRTLVAVEHAKLEHSRQEAELRLLREEIQAAQAELLNRESRQQARESEFLQLSDEYDSRETSLSHRALELLTKTETLALLEIALSDRAKAMADAEQSSAAAASDKADVRYSEQLSAIEAKWEDLDRREAEIVEREVLLCTVRELQKAVLLSGSKPRQANEQLELRNAELAESVRYAGELNAKPAEYSLSANPVSPVLQAGTGFGSGESCETLTRELDLRAELLDCRDEGLRKPAAENVTPPLGAFVDLSEPSGENPSVVFLFGCDAPPLAATEPVLTVSGDAEPALEEDSYDVLRDYMEQLLLRYRKSAGTTLPGELTATFGVKDPAAISSTKSTEGSSPESPPKVKSYFEQYMAGNMGNLDNCDPKTMSAPNIEAREAAAFDDERSAQLRPKMDFVKLQENMVSFRTLSALSVEYALASHAVNVVRLGFIGRLVIAALLTMITLLLGIANACGAIDAHLLMCVTLISATAIWTELYSALSNLNCRSTASREKGSATNSAQHPAGHLAIGSASLVH